MAGYACAGGLRDVFDEGIGGQGDDGELVGVWPSQVTDRPGTCPSMTELVNRPSTINGSAKSTRPP